MLYELDNVRRREKMDDIDEEEEEKAVKPYRREETDPD